MDSAVSRRSTPRGSGAANSRRPPRRGRARRRRRMQSRSSTPAACASPKRRRRDWVTHQWLKKAVLLSFRLADNVRDRPRGPGGAVPRSTTRCRPSSRATTTPHFAAGGRPRRAAGGRAARRLSSRSNVVLMPSLRQHRRLCRRRHDGRHLGHRRLVRADRQERPLVGRCRHRRRLGAAAGQPHHHRGQLLHRRALGSRRRRDRRGELGAGHGRVHRPEHQDLQSRDAARSATAACPRDRSSSPAACRPAKAAASSTAR